jgi:hypothetical protein
MTGLGINIYILMSNCRNAFTYDFNLSLEQTGRGDQDRSHGAIECQHRN